MAENLPLSPILAHLAQIHAIKILFQRSGSVNQYYKELMTQSCENLVTEGRADKQRDTQVRVIS